MIIYRVEHYSGEGPFARWENSYHDSHCRKYNSCQHPTPYNEIPRFRKKWRTVRKDSYIFGCRSKTQLISWFRSRLGRRAMVEQGYLVTAYECGSEHTIVGRYQVAFDRNEARPVKRFNLETLRPLN